MATKYLRKLKQRFNKTSRISKLLLVLFFAYISLLAIMVTQNQQELRLQAMENGKDFTPPWYCFGLGADCSKVQVDPQTPGTPLNQQGTGNQQNPPNNTTNPTTCTGLTVTTPLSLNKTTLLVGESLKGTIALTNNCATVMNITNVYVKATNPQGQIYTFTPQSGAMQLLSKQSVALQADFTVPLTASAGAWTAVGVVESGNAQPAEVGTKVQFTVQEPCKNVDVTTPLAINPNPVPLGGTALATVTLKNNCTSNYTLRGLLVTAIDPNGKISSFEPGVTIATVSAGQEYKFQAQRVITNTEPTGQWTAAAQGDLVAPEGKPINFTVGVATESGTPNASNSANPNIGKPCSATVKCASPLLCTNNKCADPNASKSADPNIGKPCSATVKCASPLVCTAGKCALQADPDASKAGALKACATKYDLTKNPLKKNFGDPKCDFDKNKLYAQLKKEDPKNADKWFNLVIPCHGNFNPNRYDKCIPTATTSCGGYDPAGMWGLFGMGRGLNGAYDKGDVPWGNQATNAINYNNKVLAPKKIQFKYWGNCVKAIWGT